MSPKSARRRVDLDFVRGIAIFLAMGWHFNGPDSGYGLVNFFLQPGRLIGWAGVDLFFVLSGFLVGTLIFQEFERTAQFRAKRFIVRRAFKIWPILYLYVGFVVLIGRYRWSEVIPQVLFHVQNFFSIPLRHLWSLAVEEHFYLAAALLFSWLAGHDRIRGSTVPRILIGVMFVVPLFRLIGVAAGLDDDQLLFQTQFRIDALACGVLLAHLRVFEPARLKDLAAKKVACALIVAGGVALLIVTRDSALTRSTVGYTVAYVSGAAFLLLVYDAAFINRSRVAAALAWVGTYSYPMYVLQFVMFRVFEAAWNRMFSDPMPALLRLLSQYAGAILIAVVVGKLIERPMLRVRNRFFPSVTRP